MNADRAFIARLMGGDLKAAVQAFVEGPGDVLREVGAETVADAMRAALEQVEAAANLPAPHDLERMARIIRADVTALVREARRKKAPETLVGVYMGVAFARWVMEWEKRGRGNP